MWLWYEKDYFSFDVGDRVANFVRYVDDDQFGKEASRLAQLARKKIIGYRNRFRVMGAARDYLVEHVHAPALWNPLYAGIACGCVGDIETAAGFFKQISQRAAKHEWEDIVRTKAGVLEKLLTNHEAFVAEVEKTILRTRRLLKLPERESLS
jgi:hypothetical protein